ncbi:MAG: hypothetical protein WDN29_01390 [Methylovirgula sp.]
MARAIARNAIAAGRSPMDHSTISESAKEKTSVAARYSPTSIKLRYAFKTPTLRNVAERGPYMHDGSVATLEAVIDLYNSGGVDRPSRSELIHPLRLSANEKARSDRVSQNAER